MTHPRQPGAPLMTCGTRLARVPPVRLAAIDVGSNSVHVVVADVSADGRVEVVDRVKEMVRLGRHTFTTGRLPSAAMDLAVGAVKTFARLAHARRVVRMRAVATSAVREARNGLAFVRRLRRETGLPVKVITGAEEARLIFRAAQHALGLRGGPHLLLDVGGGSVELVLVQQGRPLWLRSRALGRPPGGAPRHGREARRPDAGGRGARGLRARTHRRGGADGVRLGAPRGRAARARRRAPGSGRGGGARPPARGGGSSGALRRSEPPRPPRGAPRARALRRHRRGARPARDGARAPQPCRPPARHRARDRPQPPPPPLVLPHPQHGAGRLRSARDRDHGAGGARPPQAGPEARRPGAPGAAPGGPPHGTRARRPPAHGRRARPHALRRGPAAPHRALGGPPRDRGRGGRGGGRARAVGGRAPRGPARAATRAAGRAAPRAQRRRRAPPSARERGIMSTVRGRPSALAEPHPYPGRLITVEGIDGSGKSTQLLLLDRWLTARGFPVRFTEWNSSRLVRRAMKRGKRKDLLTPTTFSLLHAVDFADRLRSEERRVGKEGRPLRGRWP